MDDDSAYDRLLALGADGFPHVAGSLASHLRRTEALLRRFGSRDALCLAGLYHAVYGTDGIRGCLADLRERDSIASIIGREAERIVYAYCACARALFHPRIGTPAQQRFADRFTGTEYPISEQALRDFCELTLANELELATSSAAFRAAYGAELAGFFERMRDLVSRAAFAAYRATLGGARPARARDRRVATRSG